MVALPLPLPPPPLPQHCVGPMARMLDKAYSMLAARAYIHQYEKYGLGAADFQHCFAHVEELCARYSAL